MSDGNVKAKKGSGLGAKTWIVIWVAGLAGQLAWNIENQWFNTFVYGRIGMYPWIITTMVAVSAIISTFSTFVSGAGSDRKGRRKPFIVVGYILWGVFTILFGVLDFFANDINSIVPIMIPGRSLSSSGRKGPTAVS